MFHEQNCVLFLVSSHAKTADVSFSMSGISHHSSRFRVGERGKKGKERKDRHATFTETKKSASVEQKPSHFPFSLSKNGRETDTQLKKELINMNMFSLSF